MEDWPPPRDWGIIYPIDEFEDSEKVEDSESFLFFFFDLFFFWALASAAAPGVFWGFVAYFSPLAELDVAMFLMLVLSPLIENFGGLLVAAWSFEPLADPFGFSYCSGPLADWVPEGVEGPCSLPLESPLSLFLSPYNDGILAFISRIDFILRN